MPKDIGKEIGVVIHFFNKIGVGVIELNNALKVGDKIRIMGSRSDFEQNVESMQIDKDTIEEAAAGQSIGIKVNKRIRVNDKIFKID